MPGRSKMNHDQRNHYDWIEMSTNILKFLTLSVALLLGAAGAVHADAISRIGYAYDKQTGEMLYSETHQEVVRNGRIVENKVIYKDRRGKVFAEKHIDFGRSPTMPDFYLVNVDNGHLEGVRGNDGHLLVHFRSESGANVREASVAMPENGIIDAGFDRFIEQNWSSLVRGDVLEREFLIPSQLDFYTFEISTAETRPPGEVVFRLQIKSMLLQMFVAPVLVHYDAESRTLLRYEGVSNIRDGEGRNYDVRIVFPQGHLGSVQSQSRPMS